MGFPVKMSKVAMVPRLICARRLGSCSSENIWTIFMSELVARASGFLPALVSDWEVRDGMLRWAESRRAGPTTFFPDSKMGS